MQFLLKNIYIDIIFLLASRSLEYRARVVDFTVVVAAVGLEYKFQVTISVKLGVH